MLCSFSRLNQAVDQTPGVKLPYSVHEIMNRWILQMGYPVVTIDTRTGNVSQKHFLLEKDAVVDRKSEFKYVVKHFHSHRSFENPSYKSNCCVKPQLRMVRAHQMDEKRPGAGSAVASTEIRYIKPSKVLKVLLQVFDADH